MKYGVSFRAKRLERRRKSLRPELNLVALMDIFTILVFFLLVNYSNVEALPNPRALTLPESVSQVNPEEVPILMVTREQVVLQVGSRVREIMSLQDVEDSSGTVLPQLRAALMEEVNLIPIQDDADQRMTRGALNIMADKDIPYATLKKVMATSTDARFARLSLAVIQRSANGGSNGEPGGES